MATKKPEEANEEVFDNMTFTIEEKETGPKEQMVTVFLPALEDPGSAGLKVDQYEHVTISNEVQDKTWYILRGEPVQVPISVFIALKEKYPKL